MFGNASFHKLISKKNTIKIFNFESDTQNIFVRFLLRSKFSFTFLPLTLTCFINIVNLKKENVGSLNLYAKMIYLVSSEFWILPSYV